MKIHSSCEIEDFVETHLCKLCAILRSRVLPVVCPHVKDIGRRLPLQLHRSYQGQQGDVSQSVRGNYKTRFWGGQNLTVVEGNASVYQVNPVSRILCVLSSHEVGCFYPTSSVEHTAVFVPVLYPTNVEICKSCDHRPRITEEPKTCNPEWTEENKRNVRAPPVRRTQQISTHKEETEKFSGNRIKQNKKHSSSSQEQKNSHQQTNTNKCRKTQWQTGWNKRTLSVVGVLSPIMPCVMCRVGFGRLLWCIVVRCYQREGGRNDEADRERKYETNKGRNICQAKNSLLVLVRMP